MEVNNYDTYFEVIFKCVGKEDTICHFFPQDRFLREQYDEIRAQVRSLSERFEGLRPGLTLRRFIFSIFPALKIPKGTP